MFLPSAFQWNCLEATHHLSVVIQPASMLLQECILSSNSCSISLGHSRVFPVASPVTVCFLTAHPLQDDLSTSGDDSKRQFDHPPPKHPAHHQPVSQTKWYIVALSSRGPYPSRTSSKLLILLWSHGGSLTLQGICPWKLNETQGMNILWFHCPSLPRDTR